MFLIILFITSCMATCGTGGQNITFPTKYKNYLKSKANIYQIDKKPNKELDSFSEDLDRIHRCAHTLKAHGIENESAYEKLLELEKKLYCFDLDCLYLTDVMEYGRKIWEAKSILKPKDNRKKNAFSVIVIMLILTLLFQFLFK